VAAVVHSVAAPPKGHTRKLSGKRTDGVEESLPRTLESGSGFVIEAGCPPKGRATNRSTTVHGSRNLSGTEDRGVTHRNRYAA
jgi:hypothetical protein